MALVKCQQCGRKFKYTHQLRKHRKVHSMMNRTTYRCKICNKAFAFLSNLRQHLAQHFNYKSGENLYIDDLAIGVTIEPVDETSYGWSAAPRTGKAGLGSTRESPEGEPCHCVPSENYAVNFCGPMYSCGECPRHYAPRSQYLPCTGHCVGHQANAPCCCSFNLQTDFPQARCTATHHINPQLVLHVDTTHGSPLTFSAPDKDCVGQEKGDSEFTSLISAQYKQICSRRCVPIRSATVTRHEGYDADNDLADVSDSDDVYLEPSDEIPVISSRGKGNPGSGSKATVTSATIPSSTLQVPSLKKTDNCISEAIAPREDHERSENQKHESETKQVVESRKSYGLYGCRNNTEQDHDEASDEGMDFDDVATLKDLSTLFPDFGDQHSGPNPGQSISSNGVIESELNHNELILGIVDKDQSNSQTDSVKPISDKVSAVTGQDTAVFGDSCSKGNELSDIEACVKNGLDSKAINPTVVVNDLQNDMDIMSLTYIRKDDDRTVQYNCELCSAVFENKVSFVNHMRLKNHSHEREKKSDTVSSPDLHRRRSERPVRKCTVIASAVESESPVSKRISPRRIKTFPASDPPVPKSRNTETDSNSVPDITEDLKAKIGRACKRGWHKKHIGPKLRATVKKVYIKCYICGREFTTKQHFIVHAKDHLKKLGYSHTDLFYCTICYAFYPCESDLRDHLIDKHANDDLSSVDPDDHQNHDPTEKYTPYGNQTPLTQGGSQSSKTNINRAVIEDGREQEASGPEKLDSSFGGNRKEGSGSDSDMAESTTDQLIPWHSDSHGTYNQSSKGLESSQAGEPQSCMCHICGETLGSLSQLGMHLKVHDKIPLKTTILPQQPETERKFSQTSVGNVALESSYRTTNPGKPMEKRPFSCHVCGRMFNKIIEVEYHMTTHDPKRPKMKCPLCQGECMWKGNFRNHLLRHATPVGQSFNMIKFNPYSKVLCPFCGQVNIFYDENEFKCHMLEHVNKILAEECARTGNFASKKAKPGTRKRPVEVMQSTPNLVSSAEQYQVKKPCGSSTVTRPDIQEEERAHAHVSHFVQKSDDRKTVYARGYSRPASVPPDSSDQKPFHPHLSAGMTSTPNPYSGPQDTASGLGSVDSSPGGSLRGNSGLFMSPEWAWPSPSHTSSSGMGGSLEQTVGSRMNTSQRVLQGSKGQTSYEVKAENKRSVKSRPELNDSGFIQTFSGESDNGDTVTPQSVRHFSSAPKSPHVDMYMQQPSTSALVQEEVDLDSVVTKYDFLSLARVSELMTTTSLETDNFLTEGYPCCICRQYRLNQANVKQHLFTHFDNSGRFEFIKKDGKHECPLCTKMISDRRSATAHLFAHWGATIIKCPVCNRPFNLVKTMKMHVKRVHPDFEFSTECWRKM